eukprot:1159340-Pelagomonas_calceolata.AAC.1
MDTQNNFYEKFQYRMYIGEILAHLWEQPSHRYAARIGEFFTQQPLAYLRTHYKRDPCVLEGAAFTNTVLCGQTTCPLRGRTQPGLLGAIREHEMCSSALFAACTCAKAYAALLKKVS